MTALVAVVGPDFPGRGGDDKVGLEVAEHSLLGGRDQHTGLKDVILFRVCCDEAIPQLPNTPASYANITQPLPQHSRVNP